MSVINAGSLFFMAQISSSEGYYPVLSICLYIT